MASAKKKAPIDAAGKRREWLRRELDAADAGLLSVKRLEMLDTLALQMVRPSRVKRNQTACLKACVDTLDCIRRSGRKGPRLDPVTLGNFVYMLRELDDAFEALSPERAGEILRERLERDLFRVVAHLAREVGAFGCGDRPTELLGDTVRRFKNSGS